ncbi:MAG: CHAT domain-containing protein, partial [Nitrospirae bacterium]
MLKLIIKRQSPNYYSLTFSAKGYDGQEITVKRDDVERLQNSSRILESLFSHHEPHRFNKDFVRIGRELFHIFLEPFKDIDSWLKRAESSISPSSIIIETTEHLVGTLPWELLYKDEYGFLAASPHFQIIRTVSTYTSKDRPLPPGPLRVLFMACSPEGTAPLLNYEHEEEIILDALTDLKREKRLHIDISETGTLEELKSLIKKRDYHIIHISGHGYYDEHSNTGYLLMEHESGTERQVSAQDLTDALIGSESIRLLFLSACETGREIQPNTGLARVLISKGVPMVIAMTYPIWDSAAIQIAKSFYSNLTARRSVTFSLKMARSEYAKTFRDSFQWAIPALFSQSEDNQIIDWNKPSKEIIEEKPIILYERKIKHLTSGFIGRRRELREHLRQLRSGKPPVLCITGSGGIGKSTLASKITDRLHNSGFMIIPMYGEITPDRFIENTIRTLVSHGEQKHIDYLRKLIDYKDKINYILSNIVGDKDTVYFFDNFEDNLEKSSNFREFKNPFWKEEFAYIVEMLPNTRCRILITCRYSIPNIPEDLIVHAPLKEMSELEARKLMLFNEDFKGINNEQMKEVYKILGGNPKAIEDLGRLLSKTDMSWDAIKDKLEDVKKNMREFTLFEQLYDFLDDEEQSFFRCVSVYDGPVEREALSLQMADHLDENIQKLLD